MILSPAAQKVRDYYAIKPGAPIYQKEFGYYVLDRWLAEGHIRSKDGDYLRQLFEFDEPAVDSVAGLGWCEAGFFPSFEEKVLEDRGEHELVQDFAGRGVLYFKGRRSGFMPEYVTHPVTDWQTWERDVKWRLDPHTPGRLERTAPAIEVLRKNDAKGHAIVQRVIGGYMYLRSLIGPEALPYMFYDDPELIHDCMKTWFALADHVIRHHQKSLSFDELFFGEDICYKNGSLISPDMMRAFLLPYYQQLYQNMNARNQGRTLHFHIDTDGFCDNVIDLYREVGCDVMSPFEVVCGSDVVRTAQQYPGLRISGGIDKRMIALGGDDIKRHLDYIMPAMRRRGGYIPTCDHGVPEETPFEHYLLYRELMKGYCG
jgi:uroporphyrinogen decarboxylase